MGQKCMISRTFKCIDLNIGSNLYANCEEQSEIVIRMIKDWDFEFFLDSDLIGTVLK